MKSKITKTVVLVLCSLTLAVSVTARSPSGAHKEISHLFSRIAMTSSGVISNLAGSVSIHANAQSQGKPLDIRIQVHGLEANQSYGLSALLANATNWTAVTSFTTDNEGKAKLEFRDKLSGPPSKQPVPGALSQIRTVSELAIVGATNETLLEANLSAPSQFEYLLKRDISTSSAKASLQINANSHKAVVRVAAFGFQATNSYSLALNGAAVATEDADAQGRLRIAFQLNQPADVFNLQSIAILDAGTNVVVSTSLP